MLPNNDDDNLIAIGRWKKK